MSGINLKNVNLSKVKVQESDVKLNDYDMYYVYLPSNDGYEKRVRVFTDKDSIPHIKGEWLHYIRNNMQGTEKGERIKKEIMSVFVDQLSVMSNMTSRDDFIYTSGKQYPAEFLNKYMNFESELLKIKESVLSQEKDKSQAFHSNREINHTFSSYENKKEEVKQKGKSYVIGDIHGMYGSYNEAIKDLKSNDNLYIIGDVIDRGGNGLKIIKDIISRQENDRQSPNITFLMGNHEYQFYTSLLLIQQFKLNEGQVLSIAMLDRYKNMMQDEREPSKLEHLRKQCSMLQNHYEEVIKKGVPNQVTKYLKNWMLDNKGFSTMGAFFDSSKEEQQKVFNFLADANIAVPTQIKNQNYLLVHAMPPINDELLARMKKGKSIKLKNNGRMEDTDLILQMLEGRESKNGKVPYRKAHEYGFTTICGHQPTFDGNIVEDKQNGFIRIDTGCGHQMYNSKLTRYCIDDGSVKEIPQMEEVQNNYDYEY